MIDEIFDSVVCTYCGCCSDKWVLCETCEILTLKANGIDEKYVAEIRGLSKEKYGNIGGFKYSALYFKIKELIKQQ